MRPKQTPPRLEEDSALSAQMVRKLRASLPVEDLMEWILHENPEVDLDKVLGLLKGIYRAGFSIAAASTEPKQYQVGQKTLRACPQRVEAG